MLRLLSVLMVVGGVAAACTSDDLGSTPLPMPSGITWEYAGNRPNRIYATVESINEADMRSAARSIRSHNMGGDSWTVDFSCAGDPSTVAHAIWANSRVGEAQVHLDEGEYEFSMADGVVDGPC